MFYKTESDGYFKVNNSSGEFSYSILADYIYNIGYKPYTTDTDYDDPLSLKGKEFVVKPDKWNLIGVDVDFSNTQLGIIFDTGKTADFRYDCVSTVDNTLSVNVLSADYNEMRWTLTTTDTWLYFQGENDSWVQSLSGVGNNDHITIKVDDYIENRLGSYNPNEDFRTATVTLTVEGTPISSTSYIRQWNALIVSTVDEKGKPLGNIAFRRLDMGYTFDKDGSIKLIDGEDGSYIWGFQSIGSSTVFLAFKIYQGIKAWRIIVKLKSIGEIILKNGMDVL